MPCSGGVVVPCRGEVAVPCSGGVAVPCGGGVVVPCSGGVVVSSQYSDLHYELHFATSAIILSIVTLGLLTVWLP